MIEIKITTEEIESVKAPCGHKATKCRSTTKMQVGGDAQTIKKELVCLLESFEKHKHLAEIWQEALCEHLDNNFIYAEKDEESDE